METKRFTSPEDPFPVHAPKCFGCGRDNPCGLQLRAWRDGNDVRGLVTFDEMHSGAPLYAHGGAVATALDDCLGYLLYVIQEPAVTAKLEVNYRKPVLLDVEYSLRAWLDRRDGRKLFTAIDMRDAGGAVVADGSGLFLTVALEHFTKDLPADWREKAKEFGLELPW
ncbi:MAG TPA: PaaI family thioesterase [Actinomycetota bacterium]